MTLEINREAWLRALNPPAEANDPRAVTCAQIADWLGVTPGRARDRIRQMVNAGRATRTTIRHTDTTGRTRKIDAYILLDKPEARCLRIVAKRSPWTAPT